MQSFNIQTNDKCELIDITSKISSVITREGWESGILVIMIPHTTAAVTINESADKTVPRDILTRINKTIPFQGDYQHLEGNSPAHIKSSLFGCDQTVLVENNKLSLGTWQGIFFCEFDGPRTRKVNLKFIAE